MSSQSPSPNIAPEFWQKLQKSLVALRVVSFLCIAGGVFALVFTLLLTIEAGMADLTLAHIAFLTGGAICFALGLGLLNFSEGARSAGSVWLLAWGIFNLIVGFTAIVKNVAADIGLMCVFGGIIQIIFAISLMQPGAIFLCAYIGGDMDPPTIEEGILKALSDSDHPQMARYVAQARPELSNTTEELTERTETAETPRES